MEETFPRLVSRCWCRMITETLDAIPFPFFPGFVFYGVLYLMDLFDIQLCDQLHILADNPRVEHLICCLFVIVFSLALCICCILHCSTCSSAGFLSCKMINGRESHLLCNLSEMSFLCCQKVPSSIRIYSSIRIHTQYAIWGFIHLPAHCAQVHRCHKKVLFCELIVQKLKKKFPFLVCDKIKE